jgi:beta-phosphoglucomutase-like phosphatase (HAD superfamily)
VAAGAVSLRPGVHELMDDCDAAGVRQAITTTTSRSNVDALFAPASGVAGPRFAAVVCGEDVQRKKPDPEVFCRRCGAGDRTRWTQWRWRIHPAAWRPHAQPTCPCW